MLTLMGGIGVFIMSWCLNDAMTGAKNTAEIKRNSMELRTLRAKSEHRSSIIPFDLDKRLRSIEHKLTQIETILATRKNE